MDDTAFHQMHLGTFRAFTQYLDELAKSDEGRLLENLAGHFGELAERPEALLDDGPGLVARLFTLAPQLATAFPRDLLWYLGGECLHYMPDEEIETLTRMDENRQETAARGETYNWRDVRAAELGLQ